MIGAAAPPSGGDYCQPVVSDLCRQHRRGHRPLLHPLTHQFGVQFRHHENQSSVAFRIRRCLVCLDDGTGAHPDDENSALLSWLSRGRGARTAYLSITRGDGGQNLLGSELFEDLGVIRTEELLAARRLDGAQQFFTPEYEFGFSKTAEEGLEKWGHDKVLGDFVRVIRQFRPEIIVSRFTGTPADGHGHHQIAGIITQEAFKAAADPKLYPEYGKP